MYLIYNKRKQNNAYSLHSTTFVYLLVLIFCISLSGCHESLEKRAARVASDYTERNCPTPIINCSRTDSVTFDEATKTFTYYCSFFDVLDNEENIAKNYKELDEGLRDIALGNTSLKTYVDAGFTFRYIVHSASNPEKVLFKNSYKHK